MTDGHHTPQRAAKQRDETRGFCPRCGQWPKLTKMRRLSTHDYPKKWEDDDPEGRCPGSGRPADSEQTALFTTTPQEG